MPAQILKIVLLLFIGCHFLVAQTHVPAKSEVSGNWTIAGSPYIVQGEATVPQDSILSIEAGVEVRFKTGTQDDYLSPLFDMGFFRIKGRLLATGSAAQPVVFTRDGNEGNWGIIYFESAPDSLSQLKYCRIEHASRVLHPSGWMEYSGALSLFETWLRLENCRITDNAFDGLLCDYASPAVINCQISDNGANGIICSTESSPQIMNCTITENPQYGINCGYNSSLSIQNSILWENGNSVSSHVTSSPKISFSLLQEPSLPQGAQNLGSNIFALDPLFADQEGKDYSLKSNSFCINSGAPDTSLMALPEYDLDGQPRIAHQRIDMGAFEFGADFLRLTTPDGFESWKIGTTQQIRWAGSVANVDLAYSTNAGNTWSEIVSNRPNNGFYDWLIPADSSEQCLIKISETANSLLSDLSDTTFIISDKTIIADGRQVYGIWSKEYSPFEIRGLAIVPADSVLTIEPGVEVRFACGVSHDYQSPDFDLGLLKVNGRLQAEGTENDSIIFTRAEDSGNWGLIFLNQADGDSASIRYALIEYASQVDNLVDSLGFSGALSSYSSGGWKVSHSRLTKNAASGLHCAGSGDPQIIHNQISENERHGLFFSDGLNKAQPRISDNIISENSLDGISIDGAFSARIEHNRIEANGRNGVLNAAGFGQTSVVNNQISGHQSGLNVQSFIEVTGNLISDNQQGIVLDHIGPQIVNNTFVQNAGEAVFCNESSPYVSNCIFSDNGKDFNFQSGDASNPTVSYSLFQKTFLEYKVNNGGANRLGMNARFSGAGEHPYALQSNSPAIDAGTNDNPAVELPAEDLAGKPRIYDGDGNGSSVIDMGAYEYSALIAAFSADTSVGKAPFSVQFTDQSVGEIENRLWCFGDGDSSTAQNPLHTYNEYGAFTVSLTVTGPLGSVQKTAENFIVVEHAPEIAVFAADTSVYEDSGKHFLHLLSQLFFDADSADTLRYSASCTNENIHVSLMGDSLFLQPSPNYFGRGSVIIQAADRYGLAVKDTFDVFIKPLNDAPLIDPAFPDTLRFYADSSASLSVWDYVSDVESADSSLLFIFSPDNDSLLYNYNSGTGILHISALEHFLGWAKINMLVQDDSSAAAQDSIMIEVVSPVGLNDARFVTGPSNYRLQQNYPNPFGEKNSLMSNPRTTIPFQIAESGWVSLQVYNILGQRVDVLVNKYMRPGYYSVKFNGNKLPSGIYYYRIKTGPFIRVRKMVLIR